MAGMNPELAMFPPSPFSISSPFPQKLTMPTSTINRPGDKSNRAAGFSFRSRKPEHSLELSEPSLDQPTTPPSAVNSKTPTTCVSAMQSSPLSQFMASPLPLPSVSPPSLPKTTMHLRHKPSFKIFAHAAASDTPSVPKAKRNRLVRKKLPEPAFEIVTPSKVQAEEVTGQKAPRHESQVASGVASVFEERGDTSSAGVCSLAGDAQPHAATEAREVDGPGSHSRDENHDNTFLGDISPSIHKRWSHAPLLPELDFGETSTNPTTALFDPATHETTSEARISLSIFPCAAYDTTNIVPVAFINPINLTYRCDVHASDSTSQLEIEQTCQALVQSAGGEILNSYFYPGGFLYSLPPGVLEPIATSDIAIPGAKIHVEVWKKFPEPRFDGLRMHPVGGGSCGDSGRAGKQGLAGKLSKRKKVENLRVQKWVARADEGLKTGFDQGGGQDGKREKKVKNDTTCGVGIGPKRSPKSTSEAGGISLSSLKGFGRLRCGESEETHILADEPKSLQSLQSSNEKRFAVVATSSVSDDDSGAEEWESVLESVRSEL